MFSFGVEFTFFGVWGVPQISHNPIHPSPPIISPSRVYPYGYPYSTGQTYSLGFTLDANDSYLDL
jgi:hypothetical protein